MHTPPKRILIVEDNQSLVDQIRQAFEADTKDFLLEIVSSVHDAIKAIFHTVPDLVLTEQELEDGTYHDILAMSCDVWPIVVMIPFGREQGADDALNAGVLDYIIKSSGSVWHLPHVINHTLREWDGIRQRKRLTALLRGCEERYTVLFEHAGDGILHLDLAGTILQMNRSFAKMHGYDVQNMLGLQLQDFCPRLSIESIVSRLKELPEHEELTFEIENRHRDGRQIPLDVSVCLITEGTEPYLVAFHRDTRERKPDSAALQRNKSWEQIFDHVSDMIFITDADYSITYSNHSMTNQLGRNGNQVVDRKCYEIIHGLNAPPSYCPYANRSKEKPKPVLEVGKRELVDRFHKMSVMPLTRSDSNKLSLVHVVKVEVAADPAPVCLIPSAGFA